MVRQAAWKMEAIALTARLKIIIGQTLREHISLTGFPLMPRKASKDGADSVCIVGRGEIVDDEGWRASGNLSLSRFTALTALR